MMNLLNLNLHRSTRSETDEGAPNKGKKGDKTKCRFANSWRSAPDSCLERSVDAAAGDVEQPLPPSPPRPGDVHPSGCRSAMTS